MTKQKTSRDEGRLSEGEERNGREEEREAERNMRVGPHSSCLPINQGNIKVYFTVRHLN